MLVSVDADVTVVMTTYNNFDFTMASVWAIRRFFPTMKIILADGGSDLDVIYKTKEYIRLHDKNCIFTLYDGIPIEDYRNASAALVDTKYILFMDNDAKMLAKGSLLMLVDILEKDDSVAECGAYGIVISDRNKMISFVGTEYTESMLVSASSCYFALHRTSAYREVGGMPKEWLYKLPKEFIKDPPGYSGDFCISRLYYENGYTVKTPVSKVPLVHWGRTTIWFNDKRKIDEWWYKNVIHDRYDPLNDCIKNLEGWGKENNYGWKFT